MNADLNIDNYSLSDILCLFKIPKQFTEADMKTAKACVFRTHPDKSGLDPKYFIFYSKAYKLLFNVWEFKQKSVSDNRNTEYAVNENTKASTLDVFFETNKPLKDSRNFNNWFNEAFEKANGTRKDNGYGEWLKRDEEEQETEIDSETKMGAAFDRRKVMARSLVTRTQVADIVSSTVQSSELLDGDDYNSSMFSSLPFQDLHRAHTETVIPVTDEDYAQVRKFRNVNDMISFRNSQDVTPTCETDSLRYIEKRQTNDDDASTKRAFELAKQCDQAKQKNLDFWRQINTIT